MENLDPSPPNQGWENGAFWLLRDFILDLRGWGFAVPFYFVQDCNLGQNKWKTWTPPLPQIKDGKMARFGFCATSSLIWGGWGFAVPFYFVQDFSYPPKGSYNLDFQFSAICIVSVL